MKLSKDEKIILDRGFSEAFVPRDGLDGFCRWMDALLGPGSCRVLSIRPEGGIGLEVDQ